LLREDGATGSETPRSANKRRSATLARASKSRLARWKFRRQHPIDRYIVDFVTLDGKLIVEVDGATHGSAAELARDAQRTSILESLGYAVVRVTNLDVYENMDGVLEMIDRTLRPT
jgi:very-short-patch-repair endonuclease